MAKLASRPKSAWMPHDAGARTEPGHPAPELSVVMPVWNEEALVERSVGRALEVLPTLAGRCELIVVDDGSEDETPALLQRMAAGNPLLRPVLLDGHAGYWAALSAGFAATRFDLIGYVDGDLQFDLDDMRRLLPLLDRHDIVSGSRQPRRDPWSRKAVSFAYNQVLRFGGGLRVRDVNCALKVFRRDVLDAVQPRGGRFIGVAEFLLLAQRAGFTIGQVDVRHFPRAAGRSRVRLSDSLHAAADLVRVLASVRQVAPGVPAEAAG